MRKIVEERLGGDYRAVVEGVDLAEELARPTAIYSGLVLEAYARGLARAAAHVTGGGWAKIARIIPEGATAVLRAPEPPRVFRVIQRLGDVSEEEMYRVFNMGVGLVLAAPPGRAEELMGLAREHGLEAWLLGRVEEAPEGAPRVRIETPSGRLVEIP